MESIDKAKRKTKTKTDKSKVPKEKREGKVHMDARATLSEYAHKE